MRRLAILLLVAVTAAACGTPGGAGQDVGRPRTKPQASYDGTWRLTSGKGPRGPIPIVPDYSITFTLADERAEGRSACNSYSTEIKIEGSRIEFGEGSVTDMGCIDRVLESEEAYLEALWRVQSISMSRDGKGLALNGPDVELLYEPLPPPPIKELVCTAWQLETMVEGRGPEATATSAEPATLMMSRNGTFTGSTGCRRLTGEWSEQGDSILFHTMGADGHCPEDLRTQDSYVVGVLGDGFTASIDGNRLTVYHVRGSLGLIYRAD